jgi:hypothetical protein
VEGAGKAGRLHALYDWGATVTLVTHAAAKKAGLERRRQPAAAIAGLGGRCTMVDSYYMVPVVDGNDKVRIVKALGVDHIATLAATVNNLDRLVNWSNEFLGRRDNDRVYPVPINRGGQAAGGSSTTVDMNVDKENNRGGQPKQ